MTPKLEFFECSDGSFYTTVPGKYFVIAFNKSTIHISNIYTVYGILIICFIIYS